jgi:hypothetical protein
MLKKELLIFAVISIFILSSSSVTPLSGLDVDRQLRLQFDHLIYLADIQTTPSIISPGQTGTLSFKMTNEGSQFIKDIRVDLTLPSEIAPSQDVSKRKIAYMASGQVENVSFSIIPLPDTEDGVYKIPLLISYINWAGEEREDNYSLGISVGSSPKLLLEFVSSDIYKGNYLGTVKFKVINDNPGNVKFLKVTLDESEDYSIVGSNLDYVGDLNSDDFSDVSFKIKAKKSASNLMFPVVLTYKDALNKDYTQEKVLEFNIPPASEAGIKKSKAGFIFFIIVLAVIGYIIYRRYNKNIMKQKKALMNSFSTKF